MQSPQFNLAIDDLVLLFHWSTQPHAGAIQYKTSRKASKWNERPRRHFCTSECEIRRAAKRPKSWNSNLRVRRTQTGWQTRMRGRRAIFVPAIPESRCLRLPLAAHKCETPSRRLMDSYLFYTGESGLNKARKPATFDCSNGNKQKKTYKKQHIRQSYTTIYIFCDRI